MAGTVPLQPYQGSYRLPDITRATVADAMRRGIVTCPPEESMTTVARIMAAHHVHCVAVLGIEREPMEHLVWGVISDLDLVRAAAAGGEEPSAGGMAVTRAPVISADELLLEAARMMSEYDVHHIVVVDPKDQRPIGVVSTLDIAGVIAWGRG